MARQKNDGRGRMGGRKKGTPNKTTSTVKEWLQRLIDNNRVKIEQDFEALEPAERLKIVAVLLNYIVPKQQAVSVEATMQAEYAEIEKLLETAPDAVIDKIAARIMEIEAFKNGK